MRSLSICGDAFLNYDLPLRAMQALFERMFFDILLLEKNNVLELYYQGLTDVFELLFAGYLRYDFCKKELNRIKYDNHDYEPYDGDMNIFFRIKY